MASMVLFWRRTDVEGLERFALTVDATRVTVQGTIVCIEDGGFRLDHKWELTPDWRADSLRVERFGANGYRLVTLERDEHGWRVNGERRPDLDAAEEPDLSVTPFCNTLPIRRLLGSSQPSLTLDVAYVDGKDLTVTRSRQRYDRVGPNRVHYLDLGVAEGFEAELDVDNEGLVLRYQHLFERVEVRL